MAGSYRINSPQVIHEELDGEVVVIDLATGSYFSLRGTAAVIWVGITEGIATDDLVAMLESAYQANGADIVEATTGFISRLAGAGLIASADPTGTETAISGRALALISGDSFRVPILEQFDDMQDLILLDPVHDVDVGQGWPHQPADTSE